MFLEQGVKEIMNKHPEIGAILDEYGIGCAPCSVGTCKMKDIVEIHNLSTGDEEELMCRIAQVLYPGEDITIPKLERKLRTSTEIKYSPPMKRLVEEHILIKRMVALIPKIIEKMDLDSEEGRKVVLESVDFIRNFADRYHHAKEEDILFSYFDPDLDILKVMHHDHETGRGHVRAVVDGVENRDKNAVTEHLNCYRDLLTDHIRKEDEVLYPWMDRNLGMHEIGAMFQRFSLVEKEFGDAPERYKEFIETLEERFA